MGAGFFGPIIGGAIGGLGAIGAGKAQQQALEHATDAQAQASQRALDFARQRYTQLQENEAPYVQAGATATSGINDLLLRAARRNGYGYGG